MSQYAPILQTASKFIDDLSHGRFYELEKSHAYPTVAEYATWLEECMEQIKRVYRGGEKVELLEPAF